MGYWARYIGGDLWLQSYSGMSCVTPSSGQFLAGSTLQLGGSAIFAVWDGLVYASGFPYSGSGSGRIVAIRPPVACGLRAYGLKVRHKTAPSCRRCDFAERTIEKVVQAHQAPVSR